jgi:DNA-binding beta-propeller fold protein YncE
MKTLPFPLLPLSLSLLAVCPACSPAASDAALPPGLIALWGAPGQGDGEFTKPRAVAADGRGHVYAVDMTGRIQKFTEDGRFLLAWRTPAIARGRPTDIECDRDGNVIVADTHYQTIRIYSPEGKELRSWGSEGKGPGQFIYPCGVAVDREGFIYVAEFGGNDRIHKFTPEGAAVAVWGSYGDGPGQFNRPQDLAVADDGTLVVADSCNHRIVTLGPDGAFRSAWSGEGDAALRYPYDVLIDRDGNLLVCEYGNNRVQRFSRGGKPLGTWGGPGAEPGRFNAPWDVAAGTDDRVFVADTMNHRLQALQLQQ